MISLGVNYSGAHDAAAALAIDGKIVYAIAEERLSRIKQDPAFPIRAIRGCLDYQKLRPQDIDFYVVSWPPLCEFFAHDIALVLRRRLKNSLAVTVLNYLRSFATRKTSRRFSEHGLCPTHQVTHLNHHLAHALSALPYLRAPASLIFVLDGRGSRECTSVYLARERRLQLVHREYFPNSLGLYYSEVTGFCGFRKFFDEWKVMGLAPYGKELYNLDHLFTFHGPSYRVNSRLLFDPPFLTINGKREPRRIDDKTCLDDEVVKNLAYSAQLRYEQFLKDFVSAFIEKYRIRSIGLAGGVGLNSKANGYLQRELGLDEFFIQPAATDDGSALGAALYPFYQNGTLQSGDFDPYLGNEYSNPEIEATLKKYKLRFEYIQEVERDAAAELSRGNIIGWFQGRDEYGPRALGNRSILSDPRDAAMKDRVNEIVKYREGWRPFAPSLLQEQAGQVLRNLRHSPYMILTDLVSAEYASRIPAVVHVDQTLRPQTVERSANPRYWKLIDEFYRITGVPVVMNTSFNLKGEPNVSSPTDAIKTFFVSGLNLLYLGNYKVRKD